MCGGIFQEGTPRSNRVHIGFFGRRNAGKSCLLNALTQQNFAIVSDVPGSTTDPVYKNMEMAPLGPIVLVDTAGLDDTENTLGQQRIEKTRAIFQKVDIALILIPAWYTGPLNLEKSWIEELHAYESKILLLLSHCDTLNPKDLLAQCEYIEKSLNQKVLPISTTTDTGLESLRENLALLGKGLEEPPMIAHLLPQQALVVLVMPQDKQAPKGRLILPQVQVLRELLDYGCHPICTTTEHFALAMQRLSTTPDLIIVDSQVFGIINPQIPADQPLTSFSILMAGRKGEFPYYMEGSKKIDTLCESDRVLVVEACTHQALKDDIGREKIPAALRQKIGPLLQVDIYVGSGLPENIADYALIIQCASCMMTRKENMSRLKYLQHLGLAVTNYGLTLAKVNGILDRVKTPMNM
ncbi:MAG: [FeFe] hydrogenase H-cluster maturation GTPase HydF [Spirochaetia bacterium]